MPESIVLVVAENSDVTGDQLLAATGLIAEAAHDVGAETATGPRAYLSDPKYAGLPRYEVGVYIDDGTYEGGDDGYPPGYINFFFRSDAADGYCAVRFLDRMYEGSFPPPAARAALGRLFRDDLDRALNRVQRGGDWLPLGERSDQFEVRDLQAVGIGVEPLVGAARQLIDDLPQGEDAAELDALAQVVEAEMRNPRPDSVALERAVSRLSAAVAAHADPSRAARGLSEELGIDEDVAADTADRLIEIVRGQVLGDADPDVDREAATHLLEELSDRFAAVEEAVAEHLSAAPDDEVRERLRRIEKRLAESRDGWPRAIGQNLAAAAIWQLMFSGLGIGGTALKALVWTMIAVYKILDFG